MPKRPRLQPLPPVALPPSLVRSGCACSPASSARRAAHQPCAACRAWDQGRVLLADGTTLAKAVWMQAHAPADEEVTHARH